MQKSHPHTGRERRKSLLPTLGGKHLSTTCDTSAARAPIKNRPFKCRGVAKVWNSSATLGHSVKKVSSPPSAGAQFHNFATPLQRNWPVWIPVYPLYPPSSATQKSHVHDKTEIETHDKIKTTNLTKVTKITRLFRWGGGGVYI